MAETTGVVLLKRDNIVIYCRYEDEENDSVNTLGDQLLDYKLMCFNGKVRCSFVCSDRGCDTGLKVTFFDEKWNRLPFERHYPLEKRQIVCPVSYREMIKLTEKVVENLPFARIDFYEINGKPYFGEITLFPGSGFEEFSPDSADEEVGKWLELP